VKPVSEFGKPLHIISLCSKITLFGALTAGFSVKEDPPQIMVVKDN